MKPKFGSYIPKRTGTAFQWSKKQERRSGAFRLETNPVPTFTFTFTTYGKRENLQNPSIKNAVYANDVDYVQYI